MPKIIYFPALATSLKNPSVVTKTPVWKTDEVRVFDERLGGQQNCFRLSIHPWDLQRIVAEANRMGREGITVVGFGYDYEANNVVLGPK